MNRFLSTKLAAAAAIAIGALGASAAHARSDVYFSVGVQPATVYVQPRHVYVQPQPVYVQPQPVYVQPQPAYGHYPYQDQYQQHNGPRHAAYGWDRRGPYGDRDGDGIANRYDPDSPRNQHRQAWRFGPNGDIDRDGIRNQDDRDRDGDGVRNRYDRFPDNPYYR